MDKKRNIFLVIFGSLAAALLLALLCWVLIRWLFFIPTTTLSEDIIYDIPKPEIHYGAREPHVESIELGKEPPRFFFKSSPVKEGATHRLHQSFVPSGVAGHLKSPERINIDHRDPAIVINTPDNGRKKLINDIRDELRSNEVPKYILEVQSVEESALPKE